jgi:hypothetical protein
MKRIVALGIGILLLTNVVVYGDLTTGDWNDGNSNLQLGVWSEAYAGGPGSIGSKVDALGDPTQLNSMPLNTPPDQWSLTDMAISAAPVSGGMNITETAAGTYFGMVYDLWITNYSGGLIKLSALSGAPFQTPWDLTGTGSDGLGADYSVGNLTAVNYTKHYKLKADGITTTDEIIAKINIWGDFTDPGYTNFSLYAEATIQQGNPGAKPWDGSVAKWDNDYPAACGVGPCNPHQYGHSGTIKFDRIVVIPAPGAIVLGWLGLGLVGWLKRRFA